MPDLPRTQITTTFTDVPYELFAVLAGQPLTALPTPQNRDARRRATLQKGTP